MPPSNLAAARSLYNRDSVLSASPARLLVMLYDRLLLDLARAETAQLGEDWPLASAQLLHAQEIVTELINSLKPEVWDGGPGLLAVYNFVLNDMVQANIQRDVTKTRECITLLEPLRLAWHEAALKVSMHEAALRRDAVG
ncbi:flagellar export chaperone FliS [Amnibacterium setariae]|uniref:Flagellar export chaperone FliS n=1 Tax=Amnibacterium setariae TaxID=2306585 RepID=A0A3A1U5J2_9MICO|nr:flagellar export chaperone FliS [Amnibacterium setariae]RIX30278.1 flagellar export chaperone FliS [Amnibacterium setariae]